MCDYAIYGVCCNVGRPDEGHDCPYNPRTECPYHSIGKVDLRADLRKVEMKLRKVDE